MMKGRSYEKNINYIARRGNNHNIVVFLNYIIRKFH